MRSYKPILQSCVVALTLAVVSACAETRYVYRPTEHGSAALTDSGYPAALYAVAPSASAQGGEIKLASLGIFKTEEPKGRHLVIRMVLNNTTDAPWRLDTSQQRLAYPSGEQLSPVRYYVNTPGNSYLVDIAAGQERTVDLLFAVPRHANTTSFQINWTIETASGPFTQRTGFRRDEMLEDAYGPGYYSYGYVYGYPGYFSPFYSPFYPFYPYPYWPRRVVVVRPPYHSGPRYVSPPPPAIRPPPPIAPPIFRSAPPPPPPARRR